MSGKLFSKDKNVRKEMENKYSFVKQFNSKVREATSTSKPKDEIFTKAAARSAAGYTEHKLEKGEEMGAFEKHMRENHIKDDL